MPAQPDLMASGDGGMPGVAGEQDDLFMFCKFLYGVGLSGLCVRHKSNSNYFYKSRYSLSLIIEMF